MSMQTTTEPDLAAAVDPVCGRPEPRNAVRAPEPYGSGPEGYWRPDASVREEVSQRLSDDDELDARDITVTVFRGEVRLEGMVVDRYCRRRARLLALAVTGVRDVKSRLHVQKGWLREWCDRVRGSSAHWHRGHAGGGTHNAPPPARVRRWLQFATP
ncbi:MAG TPA: BON domain-containing protein [Polyangiaceae bacterium]|nr:BON domain-containing protein [Polyangiaceae bacterium]